MITQENNSKLFDEARARISLSTIGFLSIAENKFDSLGSGTLVAVGETLGVVTAAHVVVELRKHEKIGLVSFARDESKKQKAELSLDHVRDIQFPESGWVANQDIEVMVLPDLAFVALPLDVVSTLKAIGCVYLNLIERRSKILENKYGKKGFWCVAGVVAERMTVNQGSIGFEASVEPGDVARRFSCGGFDYIDFVSQDDDGYGHPSSYKGMSGGGLWVGHGSDEDEGLSEINFLGVNFWQSPEIGKKRFITCHSFNSLYGPLLQAVLKMA